MSFGFCLTGLKPPRKSDVSMFKWQLTEYSFRFAKDANIWQMVVFPHLLEIYTRLISSICSNYIAPDIVSARGEPMRSHYKPNSTEDPCKPGSCCPSADHQCPPASFVHKAITSFLQFHQQNHGRGRNTILKDSPRNTSNCSPHLLNTFQRING